MNPDTERSLDELRDRFFRGEISPAEYIEEAIMKYKDGCEERKRLMQRAEEIFDELSQEKTETSRPTIIKALRKAVGYTFVFVVLCLVQEEIVNLFPTFKEITVYLHDVLILLISTFIVTRYVRCE